MLKKFSIFLSIFFILLTYPVNSQNNSKVFNKGKLEVSSNGRFLQFSNGQPFFWLGDTGWLLFSKLTREEADRYLRDRYSKGFNVIQAMVIHGIPEINTYGDSAFTGNNTAKLKVTKGNDPNDSEQYDFWDHIDYIVDKAKDYEIFIAMVPVWGSNVRSNKINKDNAEKFIIWLVNRYKSKENIIWINGGDTRGDLNFDIWNMMGNTLHRVDPEHLITFHPYGRTQSSEWFNNEPWLSFNMFQSGHKSYSQDPEGYGEDNWKYVRDDFIKVPVKPTLDGEPSYENIPHGLHDPAQPRWNDNDVRRYAYWSVFSGACGFTYGDNAVMQMHKPADDKGAYGVKEYWFDAINDPGASEVKYLKMLMLSEPYFERVPDQTIIADTVGNKYNYLAATRGKSYLFVYTYNGRKFKITLGRISGDSVYAYWYNPRNGNKTFIDKYQNKGIMEFDPPGVRKDGNDWVLILKDNKQDKN
jgi:Protein of unknown function (DUF4038)/Putative collagen-binding domain of a collagenase